MLTDIFTNIFKNNLWKSPESRSGRGSEVELTANIRKNLPILLRYLDVHSILDASCGDFNWMKLVELEDIVYHGVDIVPELIQENQLKYGNELRSFTIADITKDKLPKVDLIMCRCTLYHLSYVNIQKALRNFKAAKPKYLLLTNMPSIKKNTDIKDGGYRRLNLERPPFNLKSTMFFEDVPSTHEVMSLFSLESIK